MAIRKKKAARAPIKEAREFSSEESDAQLQRVRRICFGLPGTTERLSHGEPTFFAGGKRVFTMFANNHHHDGHLAVWIPAAPGVQESLIEAWPKTFFRPPYVGASGWVGVDLDRISDEDLEGHILEAWKLVATKSLQGGLRTTNENLGTSKKKRR